MRPDEPLDGPDANLAGARWAKGGKVKMTKADLRRRQRDPKMPATPDETDFFHETNTDDGPHMLEHELAERWRLTRRTLQRWRRTGRAPAHLIIGQRVLYRRADVEAFERCHLQAGEEAT